MESIGSIPGEWKTYEGDSIEVQLTANDHLVVLDDSVVLESLFLPMCTDRPLKILRKLSNVVIMCTSGIQARIFKINFRGDEFGEMKGYERALEFMSRVRKYCAMPKEVEPVVEANDRKIGREDLKHHSALVHDVLQRTDQLPTTYQEFCLRQHQQTSLSDNLEEFVLLCLSDPAFSAYVSQVETVLKKLTGDK